MNKIKIYKTLIIIGIILSYSLLLYCNISVLRWDSLVLVSIYPIVIVTSKAKQIVRYIDWCYYAIYYLIFLLLSLINTNLVLGLLSVFTFYIIGKLNKIPLISIFVILMMVCYRVSNDTNFIFDIGCLICALGMMGIINKFRNTKLNMLEDFKSGPFI